MLLQVIYSIGVLIVVITVCVIAFAYVYGGQMARNRIARVPQQPANIITYDKISNYFKEYGCIVCHSTPVLNTDKWVAFIIKDGKYQVVTVFTNGDSIVGNDLSLA